MHFDRGCSPAPSSAKTAYVLRSWFEHASPLSCVLQTAGSSHSRSRAWLGWRGLSTRRHSIALAAVGNETSLLRRFAAMVFEAFGLKPYGLTPG